jgi:hypothetical protein
MVNGDERAGHDGHDGRRFSCWKMTAAVKPCAAAACCLALAGNALSSRLYQNVRALSSAWRARGRASAWQHQEGRRRRAWHGFRYQRSSDVAGGISASQQYRQADAGICGFIL